MRNLWTRVEDPKGELPKPRLGHKVCSINNGKEILILNGANRGKMGGINVFDTVKNCWSVPNVTGDIPKGITFYDIVTKGNKIIMFGGMIEYCICTNEMYQLNVTKWEWKKLEPGPTGNGEYPKPRYGHSFTLIGKAIYMFGGVAIPYPEKTGEEKLEYLNDLYSIKVPTLHGSKRNWTVPETHQGTPPSPRDLHTAVSYQPNYGSSKLHGGIHKNRPLRDVHVFEIDSSTWSEPVVHGFPAFCRFMHTSTLVDETLYVFGGSVPNSSQKTKCSDQLSILNVLTFNWQNVEFRTELFYLFSFRIFV